MTARASAAFCSSPAPPDRHRDHPDDHRGRRHQHRPDRVWPALIAASKAVLPSSCCSRAKVTSRIEFAEATPTAMIAPISDGTFSVVPVMNSIVTMPHKRRRQRQDHDERIAEVLVVHHHQQIDEDRGKQQPDAEIRKGRSCSGSGRRPELSCRASAPFCSSVVTLLMSPATLPRSRPCTLA